MIKSRTLPQFWKFKLWLSYGLKSSFISIYANPLDSPRVLYDVPGETGFLFSQFLVLLTKDFKNSLRRNLTLLEFERKRPPQASENPGSHQEERWRQCHVIWVRHRGQRPHAERAGCLGKHAPWLVLAKNLESKFKGHLIPVPGQKVVSEARDENKEWLLRNRMQS